MPLINRKDFQQLDNDNSKHDSENDSSKSTVNNLKAKESYDFKHVLGLVIDDDLGNKKREQKEKKMKELFERDQLDIIDERKFKEMAYEMNRAHQKKSHE